MNQRLPAAVLFDMDGTLLDSEPLWSRAFIELLRHVGADLPADAAATTIGLSIDDTVRLALGVLGPTTVGAAFEAARGWLVDRAETLFSDGVTWRPGAERLVTRVWEANVPTAVVTTSERRLVEMGLGPKWRAFGTLVCAGDVARQKPDPEPYRTAAYRLGVDPRLCVAIEDSPAGAAAAQAAGCAVLVVPRDVEVPAGPGRTMCESLTKVELSFLGSLVNGREAGDAVVL